MGNEAVKSPDGESIPDENRKVAPQTAGQVDDESSAPVDGEKREPDSREIEIVHTGDDGSQPKDKTHGIRKRVNKLNAKVRAAEGASSQAVGDLVVERERNRLLQLALDQRTVAESIKPPDPNDFDDGAQDPKYVEGLQTYNRKVIEAEVKKQTSALLPSQSDTSSATRELERRQTKHYEQADELGAVDYQATEDKAVDILGKENVNQLISNLDRSPVILYYLGKNPDKAEEIRELLDTNPVQAVLKIGALEAELKVQPKAKSNPTPEPDDELPGGSPAATGAFAKRFEKAIALAQTGDSEGLKRMAALRKEAKAKGITLER